MTIQDPSHEESATTEPAVADNSAPRRRLGVKSWIAIATAVVVLGVGAGIGIPAEVAATEHQEAVDALAAADKDAAAAHKNLVDALGAQEKTRAAAAEQYTGAVALATALTDTTIADPATREQLLTGAKTLAAAAHLALDPAGAVDETAPPITGPKAPETTRPADETTMVRAQTRTITGLADRLKQEADAAAAIVDDTATATSDVDTAVDALLASATAKGATLAWDRAPAETDTVHAAATALTADPDTALPKSVELAAAYAAAITAAGAQQDAVLAAEAAAEAERQAAEQRSQSGSRSNGNRGGSNPGGGGGGGGGNPGGGTNPGGGGPVSNWQPLKVNVTGSECSGSGSKVTYGSTLNIPGTNLDTYSTYEIPGYGWGAKWSCAHW